MLKSSDPLYRRIRKHAKQRIQFLPTIPKGERLKGYKEFLRLEREMIIRYHRKGDSGIRVCSAGAILVDVILESIFRTALLTFSEKYGTLPCTCSLLGLGGYGRGELNPLSDIDIQFLFPDDVKPSIVADMKTVLTDEVLYPLWDLGFKVGHSTRTVKESIEESQMDYKTRNSLLESRLILGSKELHKSLKTTYRSFLDKKDLRSYVEEMILLQEKRRIQYGGGVFHAEPNIKNGVGGLRDHQGILWLLRLMYGSAKLERLYRHDNLFKKDVRDFEAAYDFLLRVRNELHLNSNRATDELTLGVQPMIAANLGYVGEPLSRVEKLMKDYYFHARNNLRIARSMEKRILSNFAKSVRARRRLFKMSFKRNAPKEVDGFLIVDDTLQVKDSDIFDQDPRRIIKLFRLIQVMDLKLSVELEQLVKAKTDLLTNQVVRRSAVRKNLKAILSNYGRVFPALDEMYNLEVLSKWLPEFNSLSCYIQHDRHLVRYSEDQKVLNSIQQLDEIAKLSDEKRSEFLPQLDAEQSICDLYWALLLYSIKYPGIFRGASNQRTSKTIKFEPILKRLGVDEEQRVRILSFIDCHRKVAHFWHEGESDDNRLIDRFADSFISLEVAKLSFWFFYFEALGRNPQYWKLHSIESATVLFEKIVHRMESGATSSATEDNFISKKDMTRAEVGKNSIPDISIDEVDAHFHLLPERYFASRNVEDVELHISLVHKLLETILNADSLGTLKPVIDWKDDVTGDYSVINVVTWDRSGLFYKLAGAISSVGLNILKARAISRSDHIAIDTFYVKHGKTGQVECEEIKQKFESSIEAILVEGEKAIGLVREQYENSQGKGLLRRSSDFDVTLPVQVDVYYDNELKQVVVDYQGKDRIGLLYRISRVLTHEQLNIDSVRIATSNQVASGTIFLTDEVKKRANDVERISEIREKLIGILSSEIWLKD